MIRGRSAAPAAATDSPSGDRFAITRVPRALAARVGEAAYEDEALLRQIAEAARAPHADPSQGLMIYDARSLLAATGNNLKGGGYEDCTPGGGYSTCDIEFLNIGNIHLMRRALVALSVELAHTHTDTGAESGYVASSGAGRAWLDFQAQILDGAAQIREKVLSLYDQTRAAGAPLRGLGLAPPPPLDALDHDAVEAAWGELEDRVQALFAQEAFLGTGKGGVTARVQRRTRATKSRARGTVSTARPKRGAIPVSRVRASSKAAGGVEVTTRRGREGTWKTDCVARGD